MRKYGESKTTRILMATVPHVTSSLGLRKFQADGFLLTRVYIISRFEALMSVLVRIQVPRCTVSRKTRRYITFSSSETRQAQHLGSLTGSCTTRDKPRVTCCYKRLSAHSRLNPNSFKHVFRITKFFGKKIRPGCTFLMD